MLYVGCIKMIGTEVVVYIVTVSVKIWERPVVSSYV